VRAMHFEYEITADQFVASQLLNYKLSGGRKHRERAAQWILAGVILVAIAWSEWSLNWTPILLALIGAWWIYSAVKSLFLARYFRREYPKSDVAGKRFEADVGEDGFEVTGDQCSWRVRWPGVRVKGENEQVFMLHSHGTLFIFGKRYLNAEQQEHLRRLSGLA
jgi:ABC-type nickel/cobalt efflux system permease component RcnA